MRSASRFRVQCENLDLVLGLLSNNGSIRSGTTIRFKLNPAFKLPTPYDVYWRVVNTGAHADSEHALRGEPFTDHTGIELVRWEPTKYTGKHWVDCYIVHSGKIIAVSDKFYVNITNPKWLG